MGKCTQKSQRGGFGRFACREKVKNSFSKACLATIKGVMSKKTIQIEQQKKHIQPELLILKERLN